MYTKPIIATYCAIVILMTLNLGCQNMLKQGHIEAPPATSSETEAADVPVSPYGFGPYSELPPGYPKDFWDGMSTEHELIARVRLKLNAEGGSMRNGLVYVNFRDTVYVEWSRDGEKWYVSHMIGLPETVRDLRGYPPLAIHCHHSQRKIFPRASKCLPCLTVELIRMNF